MNAVGAMIHSEESESKLVFTFNLIINELSCIPLLHGVLFLHWRVGRVEGYSPHFPVKEHQIEFRMSFHLEHSIALDRITNVLEDMPLRIDVNQESKGGQDYIRFGMVTINLSEFAGTRETTRKYLLDQSKTNAALSITVCSTLKGGGAPFFKVRSNAVVPEPSKKFVSLEEEEDGEQAEGFRAHVAEATLISDQRYMVRQREFLRVPAHVVATRVPAADVIEDLLTRMLDGGT